MRQIFNLDYTALSRAFSIFVHHMIEKHSKLLTNNLEYWAPSFPFFAERIRHKLASKCGVMYEVGQFIIAMFHDCTVIATCRPGAGPVRPGIDAERFDNFIQMAFYNGWKKHHGYKYLTAELPNGMCAYMFGPKSFRCNDLELMSESDFNGYLAAVQQENQIQYKSYGDGIFIIDTHTVGKFYLDPTEAEQRINRAMSSIRIANEWDYMATHNLYPFVKDKFSQKIRKNKFVTRYYFVATLLRNAHMCLYEGLTSSYFDCRPPSLESYFGVDAE
jgi:DDE superfamily endonuclease